MYRYSSVSLMDMRPQVSIITDEIETRVLRRLREDTGWGGSDSKRIEGASSSSASGPDDSTLWLSTRGVTAYPHYDTSDNVFVQLWGTKTFRIAKPSYLSAESTGGALFPSLHPRYRQILDLEAYRDEPSDVVEVIRLNAGDLLYLPAYYLHEVISETASTSINFWTHSDAFLRSERLFKAALPFEIDFPTALRKRVVVLFVETLLVTSNLVISMGAPRNDKADDEDTCDGNSDAAAAARTFVRERLWRARYLDAFREAETTTNGKVAPPPCFVDADAGEGISGVSDALRVAIVDRARDVHAELLRAIEPASIRELYALNFVEHLSLWAVGPDEIFRFLEACFG